MKIQYNENPSPKLVYIIEELNKSIDRLKNMKSRLEEYSTLNQQKEGAKETLSALISDLKIIEENISTTIKKCGYLGIQLGELSSTDFIKKHQILKQLREHAVTLSKYRQERTHKTHQSLLTERTLNQINYKISSLNIENLSTEFEEEIYNEINPDLEIIMQETGIKLEPLDIDFYSDINFNPDLFPTIEPFVLVEENSTEHESENI